jgi:alpha-ribazole phosphatase
VRLFVLRHAPVKAHGLCYGRLDVELCSPETLEAEVRAAVAAARERYGLASAALTLRSSPATRCTRMATCVEAELCRKYEVEPDLAELHMGEFEGRPYTELERRRPFRRFMSNWQTARPPGGETVPELEARIARLVERAKLHEQDELWCTHAGVIRALRVLREKVTWSEALAVPVPHLEVLCFDV